MVFDSIGSQRVEGESGGDSEVPAARKELGRLRMESWVAARGWLLRTVSHSNCDSSKVCGT